MKKNPSFFLMLLFLLALGFPLFAENTSILLEKGQAAIKEKNYSEAVNLLLEAREQDPKNQKVNYWLSKAYEGLGLNDRAQIYRLEADADVVSSNNAKIIAKENKIIEKEENIEKTIQELEDSLSDVLNEPVKPKAALISLDLRDVDISHAIQLIAKESNLNIIAGKDITGKITVTLNQVTPEEALDKILSTSGYKFVKNGNFVKVISSGRGPEMVKTGPNLWAKSFPINYSDPENIKQTLTTLMPAETKVITTKGINAIVIEGPIDIIRRAEALLKTIDLPPTQVMVEARIIEVKNTANANLGANIKETPDQNNPNEYYKTTGLANLPTATSARGLYYTVTNQNIEAVVEAYQSRVGYDLISSPKVMALNNESAEIITGSRLGYKVKTVTTTGMIESVEFLDVGTKLNIKVGIKNDGFMLLKIHPEVSEGSIVNDLPQKQSTETTTSLLVKDGQTIIIGGLMKEYSQETKSGVPILADIPFIGVAFRRTDIETQKREIIILISPHLVDAQAIADMEKPIHELEGKYKKGSTTVPMGLFR